MPHDARKLLEDMRQATDRLLRFTTGRTLENYSSDELLRAAVERQFEIIGEALGRLLRMEPDLATQITHYRRIVDFRNVLVHGYDIIDDSLVWDTVQNHLPLLQQEVETLLSSLNQP